MMKRRCIAGARTPRWRPQLIFMLLGSSGLISVEPDGSKTAAFVILLITPDPSVGEAKLECIQSISSQTRLDILI